MGFTLPWVLEYSRRGLEAAASREASRKSASRATMTRALSKA